MIEKNDRNHTHDSIERIDNPSFRVAEYQGGDDTFKMLGPDILAITSETFTPIFQALKNTYIETKLQILAMSKIILNDVPNPNTTLFILKDNKSDSMVGFTYCYPLSATSLTESDEEEMQLHGYSEQEFQQMQAHTVEIGATGILPAFRSKGNQQVKSGWTMMMDALDTRIKSSNEFTYMLRTVRIGDDYSEKVKKRYGISIIHESELNNSFGPQMHYRIRL